MTVSRRTLLATLIALPAAGCGFRMKGRFDVPFDTLYIALERNTPLYEELARQLKAGSSVTLTDSAQGADAVFTLVNKTQSRDILSLNFRGDVAENELTLTMTFRITTPDGRDFVPETTLTTSRTVTYSEREYLSRQNEEALLFAEMQSDLVSLILRRIEAAKPAAAPEAS
ncbi:LPS assembly lipoprotein LptE [Duodenibacillus massiliensis]|uniref:LPS-assembly lipoprotein LptE n=1 Tax=Duodenibacillus massiliensis TaxID=1852381 RepID=UPI00307BBC21